MVFFLTKLTDQRAGHPAFAQIQPCAGSLVDPAAVDGEGGALVPQAGSSEGSLSPVAEPPPQRSSLMSTHTKTRVSVIVRGFGSVLDNLCAG